MTVRVRRLEARDKPVWLNLFKGYIEFYKATVAEDVIEMTWKRLMEGAPDFHIALVAVDALADESAAAVGLVQAEEFDRAAGRAVRLDADHRRLRGARGQRADRRIEEDCAGTGCALAGRSLCA